MIRKTLTWLFVPCLMVGLAGCDVDLDEEPDGDVDVFEAPDTDDGPEIVQPPDVIDEGPDVDVQDAPDVDVREAPDVNVQESPDLNIQTPDNTNPDQR